jgi:hypothetical protein
MSQQEQKVDKWETVYQAVRAALDIRVANLNSQQQRIANVLVANGLILGFLGASAGVFFDPKVPKWPSSILYVASMSFLAFGLVAAVVALWPLIDPRSNTRPKEQEKSGQIKPEVRFFLEPESILKAGHVDNKEELLEKLSSSIVENVAYSKHVATFNFRRRLIRVQLILIVSGVVCLFFALICRLFVP